MELHEIEFNHATTIQIRFNDIDGLGHVNNAVQASYFDFGRMRYFETLTGGPIQWTKFAMVIASVHTDFMQPIFLNDAILVKTKIQALGDKSLEMFQVIADATTGQIKSTCKSVMVAIDFATGKSTPLTNELRAIVTTFETI